MSVPNVVYQALKLENETLRSQIVELEAKLKAYGVVIDLIARYGVDTAVQALEEHIVRREADDAKRSDGAHSGHQG